ncbi:MAG: OmpA family protein [Bacteroidota bacterium]
MKNIRLITKPLLVFALGAAVMAGCSRKATITDANKAFESREYFLSSSMYKQAYAALTDKELKAEAAFGAAESFRKINDYKNAEYWYNQTLKNDPDNKEAIWFVAMEMKNAERYEEAKAKFEEYKAEGGIGDQADHEIEGCVKGMAWKKEQTRYVVENMKSLNTKNSDFGVVAYRGDALFFSSDRENPDNRRVYGRTGDKFVDIYRAELKRAKRGEQLPSIGKVNPAEGLVFDYNEATGAFSGSKIYFTLCNGVEGTENSCKIYEATLSGNAFKDVTALSFCDDSLTNYGHPSVSQDGLTLYFSADLPGGFGGKDIYSTTFDKRSKSWGAPVNAGSVINTKNDDMFPFIHADGTLYFSSNGHVGMGGLDVFSAKNNGGTWEEPVNMKWPINSGADDFSFTVSDDKQNGYLSSNRDGGKGKDDIYGFYLKPLEFKLKIVVKDAKTGKTIPNATVKFTINNDSSAAFTANVDGVLEAPLMMNASYGFFASKTEDYYFDSETKQVSTIGKELSENFVQELLLNQMNVEDEFTLKGIYYDLDKADLRSESLPVIDSLITLLNKYPKIRIEIGSHTDCRSSKEYNEQLSQRRAQSVVDYLISKGIASARLEAKGYGETKLVNDCACEGAEVKRNCSEEEHQLNRRTTFRIVSK